MSTIGTTLKQPRVFAHDAIALNALCAAQEGILTLAAAVTTGGTGYSAVPGANVYATTSDGEGTGATVEVLTEVGGVVTTFFINPTFHGDGYGPGDILTLVGGGSGDDCTIAVATVGCTWQLGDPITPMLSLASSNFNTVPYWNEKMAYTYELGAGHPNPGPHQTPGPGAALYIASAMDITVVMESGKIAEFKGVAAGSFLPVSVLSVSVATPLEDVLALF